PWYRCWPAAARVSRSWRLGPLDCQWFLRLWEPRDCRYVTARTFCWPTIPLASVRRFPRLFALPYYRVRWAQPVATFSKQNLPGKQRGSVWIYNIVPTYWTLGTTILVTSDAFRLRRPLDRAASHGQ